MIGTWTHLWEIRSCLMTPPASGHLPTDCGQHPANPLPWHWHAHPAWTNTCMCKGNTVAFMRNTYGLLLQLGKHLVSQCHRIAYNWRPGCNLYDLIKWDIISHHSINLKVLDSCRKILWRDEERTPLFCREKSNRIAYLVVTWKSSSKQNKTSHQSIKFKSAWQLSGFFVEGWRTNISHLSREKSPNCLQLKTWLQLV